MSKKRVIGYVAIPLVALLAGVGIGTSSQPAAVATPTPAVTVTAAPVVTTVAPAECGTALDGASKFMLAVGTEHKTMGAAFDQAGASGDMATMITQITAAVNTLNAEMNADSPPMIAAAQVCRAAVK